MSLLPRLRGSKRKSSSVKTTEPGEEQLRGLYVEYLERNRDELERDTLRREIRTVSMVNGLEDLAERRWEKWEKEQEESNKEALERIRRIHNELLDEPLKDPEHLPTLPFLCSTVELLAKSQLEIEKTHYGDFLFHYNYIGLSEMELRALLAILPKRYKKSLDPLGHKEEWRKQVRQRLYDMLVEEHEDMAGET